MSPTQDLRRLGDREHWCSTVKEVQNIDRQYTKNQREQRMNNIKETQGKQSAINAIHTQYGLKKKKKKSIARYTIAGKEKHTLHYTNCSCLVSADAIILLSAHIPAKHLGFHPIRKHQDAVPYAKDH